MAQLADAAAAIRAAIPEAAGAAQKLADLEAWLATELEAALRDMASQPRTRLFLTPDRNSAEAANAARAALAMRALDKLRGDVS